MSCMMKQKSGYKKISALLICKVWNFNLIFNNLIEIIKFK